MASHNGLIYVLETKDGYRQYPKIKVTIWHKENNNLYLL